MELPGHIRKANVYQADYFCKRIISVFHESGETDRMRIKCICIYYIDFSIPIDNFISTLVPHVSFVVCFADRRCARFFGLAVFKERRVSKRPVHNPRDIELFLPQAKDKRSKTEQLVLPS